jgi:hypothetical protein
MNLVKMHVNKAGAQSDNVMIQANTRRLKSVGYRIGDTSARVHVRMCYCTLCADLRPRISEVQTSAGANAWLACRILTQYVSFSTTTNLTIISPLVFLGRSFIILL